MKETLDKEEIQLTKYSHGAGCGCKISPAVLSQILHSKETFSDPKLLVGNDKRDDAAVLDLENGTALISTTDFFMPIVDSPYEFGRIAAANAISDVFAMGGKPVLALAILGWPIDKLLPETAQEMMEGARNICKEVGIQISGGHSIDSPEPIFGLSVNGLVDLKNLKKNSTAEPGCKLYLTKALGVGALSTAQKKGLLKEEDRRIILKSMTTLNSLGEEFGKLEYIKAMTDVTGFGLLGHLTEMCKASEVNAVVEFDKVPVIPSLNDYLEQGCIPGGTHRNWKSYGHRIGEITERQKQILCDPQTSGGLMVAVEESHVREFEEFINKKGLDLISFGEMKPKESEVLIEVI